MHTVPLPVLHLVRFVESFYLGVFMVITYGQSVYLLGTFVMYE